MEVHQAKQVELLPEGLRYTPLVKSNVIIARRNLSLAPVESSDSYSYSGTNSITFSAVGHQNQLQMMDTQSVYFTMQIKFKDGLPVEDAGMAFEEITLSSNGQVLERIRDAQYI